MRDTNDLHTTINLGPVNRVDQTVSEFVKETILGNRSDRGAHGWIETVITGGIRAAQPLLGPDHQQRPSAAHLVAFRSGFDPGIALVHVA